MKREASLAAIAGVLLLAQGCGTTEEAEETPPVKPGVGQEARQKEFETKTDTVNAQGSGRQHEAPQTADALPVRFTVQVGAFKDPHNASRIQTIARERYHMPVINDYQAKLGLYQIRIGFFDTQAAAEAFLRKMQQDYPKEYKDSWVVQLKQ